MEGPEVSIGQANGKRGGTAAATEGSMAIKVRGLRKSFGDKTVLDGIDLVRRHPNDDDLPDLTIDDPTAVALLTSHIDNDLSPSLERLQELYEEKIAAQGLQHWSKAGLR